MDWPQVVGVRRFCSNLPCQPLPSEAPPPHVWDMLLQLPTQMFEALFTRFRPLLVAYIGLTSAIVLWNVFAAGRIVRDRRAPKLFVVTTAMGALLLPPALLIAVSSASVTYGRVIQAIAWVWPLVTVLFALQAAFALTRRLVNPFFGLPILAYNVIVATVSVCHYMNSVGIVPAQWTLILSAAQTSALGMIVGAGALTSTTWLFVPLFSPALPSRSRIKALIRTGLAIGVIAATALMLLEIPSGLSTIRSYNRYQDETLQERPAGDLRFGIKVFPELTRAPSQVSISRDLTLADSIGANAISIIVAPEAARGRSLDSLTHIVDALRSDSTTIIVTLSYPQNAKKLFAQSRQGYLDARFADIDRLARALRPNILIPAHEPYGSGAVALGTLSPEFWIDYIGASARIAHHVNPNIKIGIAASSYGTRDSALYAWAALREAPVDIVGFSLMPGFDGATSLDTKLRIAQRWMRQYRQPKPHWVWSAGGYPITHGERSQLLALRGVMSWSTTQPAIKGIVITEAGDYQTQQGLRTPAGRLRPAAFEVARSIVAIKETTTR